MLQSISELQDICRDALFNIYIIKKQAAFNQGCQIDRVYTLQYTVNNIDY